MLLAIHLTERLRDQFAEVGTGDDVFRTNAGRASHRRGAPWSSRPKIEARTVFQLALKRSA